MAAVALGAEKPEAGAMKRPPRSGRDRLIDWPLLARAYLLLVPLEAMAALAAFFFVLTSGGWIYGQVLPAGDAVYLQATAACLTAIIVMQIANVFLRRSERASLFSYPMSDNRLIGAGIALALVLIGLIDETAPGNRTFSTAPIPVGVWLFVIPFALGRVALEEGRKWPVCERRLPVLLPTRSARPYPAARATPQSE